MVEMLEVMTISRGPHWPVRVNQQMLKGLLEKGWLKDS
jgi:hypothetical protein